MVHFMFFCPNMLHAYVLCVVWNYIHGKMYKEKKINEKLGLENIALGVRKKNE